MIEHILIGILTTSVVPLVCFVCVLWADVKILKKDFNDNLVKEENRKLSLIRLGEKIDRIERFLSKEMKFDPGTDSGFF